MGVQQNWSTTAASNATADSTINFREGQAPSSVNDAARSLMAAIKKYVLDMSGTVTTGGSADAYTYTSNEGFSSLVDGLTITFACHAANTTASTIDVDSLGAKPLRVSSGSDLAAGALAEGNIYRATYDSSAEEWLLHGYFGNPFAGLSNIPLAGYFECSEIATPSAPGANLLRVYAKNDGGVSRLYCIDDNNVEREVSVGKECWVVPVGDETTAIETGTAKITFRMPYAFKVEEVRASLNTASSSGDVTVDINEAGSTILSTKITVTASKKTSKASGTTQPVLSDTSLADDAEITIDIDAAGTDAAGLKVTFIGRRA